MVRFGKDKEIALVYSDTVRAPVPIQGNDSSRCYVVPTSIAQCRWVNVLQDLVALPQALHEPPRDPIPAMALRIE